MTYSIVFPVKIRNIAAAAVTENQVTDAVNKAVEAAAKNGEGTTAIVEIKVNAPADAKSVETSIPKEAIDTVAGSKADALTVSTPVDIALEFISSFSKTLFSCVFTVF